MRGDDYYTLQNLFIQKAKQRVDIKNLVWEPRPIVRKLPNSKKRGSEERRKKIEDILEVAKRGGIEGYLTIRLDNKASALTSGYH